MPKPSSQIKLNPPPSPIITEQEIKSATAEIDSKMTNRTLVEFQSKDGTVPEWRTQLKNAVRQRKLQNDAKDESAAPKSPARKRKTEDEFFDSVEILEEPKKDASENDVLSNALDRIKSSRSKYYVGAATATATAVKPARSKPEKSLRTEAETDANPEKTSVNFPKTPDYKPNVDLYDTSELDPEFKPAKVSSSFGKVTVRTNEVEEESADHEIENKVFEEVIEKAESKPEPAVNVEYDDDRAPFAYRFNAGLFDMLITSFASMILLAPFTLLGGNWFSIAGLFGFLATFAIVNFIYLTTTVGLFGKTFGMHLFSIEMIDVSGEEYPTIHQAAVSASVYMLSMAFGGAGFLTCMFEEDGRAIHDIFSNTLVVREL
ncbi:MAG: RDD family protein [Pyrinomonadaceae bacterium]|nr:RDD family protein [Pyrinomonadaceae bacterium]